LYPSARNVKVAMYSNALGSVPESPMLAILIDWGYPSAEQPLMPGQDAVVPSQGAVVVSPELPQDH